MIRFPVEPPERRRMGAHDLIIHAKVASTSLRTLGDHVKRHEPYSLPTIAIIRNPIERWVSGYVMYLADLARLSTGRIVFQPPYHFVYDIHTTQQIYTIRKDTHLIPFEEIQLYTDRCGFNLPHLHPTPGPLTHCKHELIYWLRDNERFKESLKHHLRLDYELRNRCVSVQSLPDSLFDK